MLEKDLEKKIARWCKDNGYLTYKFSSPSMRGVPDRIIIGPLGVLFLELKRPGNEPTKLQLKHIDDINAVSWGSARADWTDSVEGAVKLVREVCG